MKDDVGIVLESTDGMAKKTGVFCVTPHFDNLLMWSHYGDSHRGVCIGFDISLPNDSVFGAGYPVEYRKSYPVISMLEVEKMMHAYSFNRKILPEFDDIITRRCYVKAIEWSYENEVRFCNTNPKIDPGLVDFPAGRLKEVILGANVSDESRNRVIKYIEKNFPHAILKQAQLSPDMYKLDFLVMREKAELNL
ncbi:DUF2971 domain-containing protein [Microbulbifer sp. PSTR4-B]|uniref:DUF2971 domain-containing protein n=1 Tax=Microbulbifer sp. PSTR4-B TaxID=3243396 RepID=UPI004039283A